jgi:type IV pilus assembly protein PilA
MAAEEKFCRVCGKEVPASAAMPAMAMPVAGAPAETSGKAIASLIFGLFLFAFPMSILAIIFGHLSLSDIKKSAGRLKGQGMAIAGLVLGYLGVAAIPIILIMAAILIPNLLRARMMANESSARAGVRTIFTAEVSYSTSHPNTGYTCLLSDLSGDGLIDAGLASGQKSGYVFELQGCGPAADGGASANFHIVAYPQTRNATGRRAFCADDSGIIKSDANGSPQDCVEKGSALQ